MAAPLDNSSDTVSTELAQAAPRNATLPAAAGDPARVASLPADCDRASLAVTVDQTIRYHLPEIPNVASFRKQTAGDAIVVSTQGHGQLVMDDFVRAAQSGHPPIIVLGDGTVLTAAQVLALPEHTLAPELCVPQQAEAPAATDGAGTDAAQLTPQTLAQAAPAAGTTPQQLAQIAPAAGPGGAVDVGEQSGGHFNSTFAPTAFEGLNYGSVDPLAFNRTPPELTPGTGTPEEAAPVNDSVLRLGDIAAKEDLGQAGDQIAAVPQPAAGPIPISIDIASSDPNESVTGITISGVPAGVTFNNGQAGPNGTWLLTQGDLAGLTLDGTPSDGDTDFTLTVTVDVSQNGTPLPPLTGTIDVVVDAVADLPTLTLSGAASGAEDAAIALPDIAAGLQDGDGSEALTLTISGVPAGASLSAGIDNGDGSWTLTGLSPAELAALTITPPADFSGSFDLTVTATATEAATVASGGELQEADNTASTAQSFTVTVAPVGDSILEAADAAIKEDLGGAADQIAAVPQPEAGARPLTIDLTVGVNETIDSITISGVPAGVTLSNGTDNGDGTWSLTPADLAGLTIDGSPSDSDAEFDLGVTVGVSQNGTTLPDLTGSIHVIVDAVADIPTLTLDGAAAGNEDTAIALPDIAAALQDTDGSESLTLTISGVPAGATLSAGTDNGDGSWTLTGLSQAQLDALTITPPADFSGSFELTVTATSTEAATTAGGGELQEADNTASTAQSFTVTVDPAADSSLETGDAAIKEDLGSAADQIASVPQPEAGARPLTIDLTVGANESVGAITISGVPAGVTLNNGTNNGDGTWSLTQADLAGLTIDGSPSDSDAEFDLGVTIALSQNGTALPDLTGSIHVVVDAVADLPTLTLTGAASGAEDTAIALPDIAAALQDADGSETLTLTISGVPAGATLSAGTDNGGGSWTLTGLSQAQLDALTITPPADYSGSFDLTVTATATEAATTAGGGELQEADNTASTAQSFTVTVTPSEDSRLDTEDSAIKEDLGAAADQVAAVPQPGAGAQPLTITLSVGAGETIGSITISGVPAGVTLNNGTDNGDGTWSLSQADLAGLTINGSPSDSDAEFDLGVNVSLSQGGNPLPDLTGSVHVIVDAVADFPTLSLTGTAEGLEDTAIALPDIAAALQDGDGSETLTLTISGVPAGATLSAGVDNGDGSWTLTGLSQAELNALTITPPADYSGSFDLSVTATATEAATTAGGGELQEADNTATTAQSFTVTVTPAEDSSLETADSAIKEDLGAAADQVAAVPQPGAGAQPLTINLTVGAGETIGSITISGVPAGVTLNNGTDNGDGTWSLTEGDLAGLTINGSPSDSDVEFDLGVAVGVSQNGTALPDLTGSVHVIVDAVADLPTLTLTGTASGAEDTAIALPDIAAALQDSDGSESLTLTISGVPSGATLSAGTDNGGGSWTLTGLSQAELNALTITPPADYTGSFDLTVTAIATEAATTAGGGEMQEADNTASTSRTLTVTVTPEGDSRVDTADSAIKEDLGSAGDQIASVPQPGAGAQPLSITLTLGANETVDTITISGVPSGVALNNGTDNGDGTWTLTEADLTGLTINGSPSDSDAEFDLGVTVGVSQNGTALPDLTGSVHVIVDAVADIPTLTLTGAASGVEDAAIALPDVAAALQDADGSETLTLTISGVPAGATLSAGTDNGDGSWTLTGLSQAELDALTITPPADFSGTFDLTVTATATEAATTAGGGELQEADNTASTAQSFTVTVTPTGDSTLAASDSAVKEDLGAAGDQIAAVPAPNAGSQPVVITLVLGANETAGSITLTGVPSGLTFNNGAAGPGNTWVLTQAQLAGLAVTGVPADSDAEIALGVVASVSQNGAPLTNLTGSLTITVDAVADVPTLTLTGAASGAEDSAIALPDIAAALQDSDSSEALSLKISGVPTGATLSAGTDNGDGSWTLTGLSQAQLDALTITPPADFAGSFDLTVTATATEAATVAGGGELQEADNTASTAQSFTVTVTPGRDSTLSVSDVAVKEDLGTAADQIAPVPQPNSGAQPVAITLALGAGETVTGITISGVPAGMTLNHGTNNGDGTWSLSQGDLAGLALSGTPGDSDAEFDLAVTVGVAQAGQSLPDLTGTVHVTVDAVADIPTLTLTGTAAGNSGTPIALPDIAAGLHDVDGSETLTLTISGVPGGATLSAGTNQGGGVWSLTGLTQAQLDALTLTPPAGYSGTFSLTVTATATEAATVAGGGELQEADNTASTAQSFSVLVNAVPSGGSASNFVGEDGIEAVGPYTAGTQAETPHEVATGTLGFDFGGDGAAASNAFAWSPTVGASDPDGGGSFSGLTSQGQAIVWSVSADGLTITGSTAVSHDVVATLTITDPATGAYSYEQIGSFDHPDVGQSGAADPIDLGFGYTITDGNGDTATGSLTIAVRDDGPIAGVVNETTTEGGGTNTNLLVVLDVSGSMDDPSGLTNLSRLDVAKAAVADLIEKYDSLGDVVVHIVTFSTDASDASDVWLTADQAISFLDSLSAGGFTNYDAALATAQAAFVESGKIADAQNVAYFLSDGKPNRPTGSPGIDGTEQTNWQNFLEANDIKSYALGMGNAIDAGELQPIAYDGITSTDIAAVVVTDLAQLSATLLETVEPSTVTGNIIVDSIPVGELGADGGYVKSIVVDGTTYTFNPTSGGSISVSGGPDNGSFDTATNTLTIDTAAGASIALDMDGGGYVYTAPTSISANVTENFAYSLVDGDGDTASSTLTFNTIDTDQTPLVYGDAIVTNVSGSGAAVAVPTWALLANDVDPDGDAIGVSAVSNAIDGAASLAASAATFTDNDSDGGSFDYTGTANGASNLGHVTIDRGQAGESTLDGTGLDEILIGRTGNDTLKGYEGDDILIGGGGTDSLQGGAGNDILVFQNLGSSYDGGIGTDVLRIGDSLGGTLDFRAAATSDSRLENIDTLAMDGGNNVTVQLDYQGTLDFEPASNTLRITGSIGDTVDLSEAIGASGTDTWIKTASDGVVDTWQYTPSAAGSPIATLIVDHNVTVT